MNAIFLVALIVTLCVNADPLFNTAGWAGAEYTPARAPANSLWLYNYTHYKTQVEFELQQLHRHFGFNTIRLFLHNMVYDIDNGTTLFQALDWFFTVASKNGMKTSLGPFFDDCWQGTGASLSTMCVPVKGRHNGCWFQSPQLPERTNPITDYSKFMPYVVNTVAKFGNDSRVRYIEIFNEPHDNQPISGWSYGLRNASYYATLALKPKVPILSCWDDNDNTQVVDMHRYDTQFGTGWTTQAYANTKKGTLITEGGSRWFQGLDSDNGSPLTVLHWYNQLQGAPKTTAPYPFGMILNWEMMVGESNTRWHWNTPDNTPEPAIPWDGWLFADGTPVSFTEAAVTRNWTLGRNDLLHYSKWLPNTYAFETDTYLTLAAGKKFDVVQALPTDLVIESAVWPDQNSEAGIYFVANASQDTWMISLNSQTSELLVYHYHSSLAPEIYHYDMTVLDCGLITNGWNMLRVVKQETCLQVFVNPMAPEAYLGVIPARLKICKQELEKSVPTSAGVRTLKGNAKFDYLGIMPITVL